MSGSTGQRDWAGAVGSFFFAAVGLYVFVTSFAMSPMAAMFPRTIGAVLAVLALAQIAMALTGRSGASVEAGSGPAAQREGFARRMVLLGTMIAWAALFPVIGLFVTSLAACVTLMFAAQFGRLPPRRLALHLAVVLAMVVIFYLLLGRVLNVPLPSGLLF